MAFYCTYSANVIQLVRCIPSQVYFAKSHGNRGQEATKLEKGVGFETRHTWTHVECESGQGTGDLYSAALLLLEETNLSAGERLTLTGPSCQVVVDRPRGPKGQPLKVAECIVGDETGTIVFTARNEQGAACAMPISPPISCEQ